MKDLKIDLILQIGGMLFAAGMLYSNIKSSGEETRLRIQMLQDQIQMQQKADENRLERIEEYLDSVHRNHLL